MNLKVALVLLILCYYICSLCVGRCPTLTIIQNYLYIALVLYKLCRHTALFVFGASLEYPKRPWFLGPSFPIVYRALEDSYLVLTWYKDDTQK